MTEQEIKEFAASVDHGRLDRALEARAANGDPRARFALAENIEEALAAADDCYPNEVLIRTNPHAGARVGRDSSTLVALTVWGDETGNIHVAGIAKSFRQQGIGHRSLELGMTKDDAVKLARAILKAAGE